MGRLPAEQFEFSKWYLDGVAPSGATFVAYWTRLQWRGLALSWHSVAVREGTGLLREISSLASAAPPAWQDDRLAWHAPALELTLEYQPLFPAFTTALLASDRGALNWRCDIPAGSVHLGLGSGTTLEGLGYAEHIHFTIPPWRLPLRELRWGRWIADDGARSLIWIGWEGPSPRRWVFLDGRQCGESAIAEREVLVEDARLEIETDTLIRSRVFGDLAGTVPGLRALLPGSIRGMREIRWLGQARLHTREASAIPGWCLFEHVVLG